VRSGGADVQNRRTLTPIIKHAKNNQTMTWEVRKYLIAIFWNEASYVAHDVNVSTRFQQSLHVWEGHFDVTCYHQRGLPALKKRGFV
jgi:hypothetical protein